MEFGKRELAAAMLPGGVTPLGAVSAVTESTYPERPLTLVVGYPPGGGTDALARVVAKHIAEAFDQKVIIESCPGATSNIAAQAVARAAPDGYTVFLSGRPNTLHKALYSKLDFDLEKDLAPVGLVAITPNLIVTSKRSSIEDFTDLVGKAKAHPGTLTCASSGFGSTGHLLCELFQQETQVDLEHIPYKGSSPALDDVIGGRVDVLFDCLPATIGQIRAGSIRIVSVLSRRRLAIARDVSTIEESGLSNLHVETWVGLMVPAGTPPHVISRLNETLNSILMKRQLHTELIELGYAVRLGPNTPEAFGTLLARESERWDTLLEQRSLKPAQ